jgi:hypothetical protein
MAKSLQQDSEGKIIDDVETKKSQKGYGNYEKTNQEAQKQMEDRDAKIKETVKSGVEKIRGVFGMKKGGKVMKKKSYEDGGEVEFETKMGRNENIGDDVRARAMAALDKGITDDTSAKSISKAAPSLPTRKAFVAKANKAGFAADQTGGGAALMTRRDRSMKKMASGGSVGSASKRADGCAVKGKTRGRMV